MYDTQVGYLLFFPLILHYGVAAAAQSAVLAYCVAWICWRKRLHEMR